MTRVVKIDTPTAKNGMTSFLGFRRRKKYIRVAYPILKKENAIDLWYGDKTLFGRVDKNNNPVAVKEEFLSRFGPNPEFQALNFVVDAYEDLINFMNQAIQRRAVSSINTFVLDLAPVKAYEDPRVAYENVLEGAFNFYTSTWINSLGCKTKNFDGYTKGFLQFADVVMQNTPITLSTYITSDFCNPSCSGLVVQFRDLDYGNDVDKWNEILTDKNFTFFQNAARKFGFKVDYNVPYRLVADITTGEMKQYMAKYNIRSVEQLFDTYYETLYNVDYEYFKNGLAKWYRILLARHPQIEIPDANREISSVTTIYTVDRQPISMEQLLADKYFLRIYFLIRIKERQIKMAPALQEKKMKKMERLYDLFDFDRAMRYIEAQT